MKKLFITSLTMAAVSAPIQAANLSVTVTNLTRGTWFTPLLVAAHNPDNRLFVSGQAASSSLQEMAEGGSVAALAADLQGIGATVVENPAAGLLGPGSSTTATINTDAAPENTRLSVVAMVLPSNDGFVGMNAVAIPAAAGTYTFNVNAYDAGTEANDEIRGGGAPGQPGFPAPGPIDAASGMNGSGVAASVEGFVHIHRNVLGDTDPAAGVSDIDSTVHRWLNPVARVTLVVN